MSKPTRATHFSLLFWKRTTSASSTVGRTSTTVGGLQDDDEGIIIPKSVNTGRIIKNVDENGNKRYDFQFENKRGYKMTIEGLSEKFNKEYWNYAKLISGVLRWRMPIEQVIKLVGSNLFYHKHSGWIIRGGRD